MKKEVQAKILSPLTIPFAISHVKDEHMIGKPNEVYNKEITGFIVTAEVTGKTWMSFRGESETEIESIEIKDLCHVGDEIRIFSDDNTMHGDLWLKMILAIPKNMKAIEKAIQQSFEEGNLERGDFVLTPNRWMEEPEGLPNYLN